MDQPVPAIYGALLAFQKKGISVAKRGVNPHFKSHFKELNDVLEAVKPVLSDLGVVILQVPDADGLTLRLVHTGDASEVSGFIPYVAPSDPQKLGANITYNRRYLLVSMLGLEDEDDDGNTASQAPKAMAAGTISRASLPGTGSYRTVTALKVKEGVAKAKRPGEEDRRYVLVTTEDGDFFNNTDTEMTEGRTYSVDVGPKGNSFVRVAPLDDEQPPF